MTHQMNAVQIIACSGDVYAIEPSQSKRTYAIIFGAILCLFAFVPSKVPYQLELLHS